MNFLATAAIALFINCSHDAPTISSCERVEIHETIAAAATHARLRYVGRYFIVEQLENNQLIIHARSDSYDRNGQNSYQYDRPTIRDTP